MDNNASTTELVSAFDIVYQNEFENPVLRDRKVTLLKNYVLISARLYDIIIL